MQYMEEEKKTKAVMVRVNRSVHRWWKSCSLAYEMSVAEMIREAMEKYLKEKYLKQNEK